MLKGLKLTFTTGNAEWKQHCQLTQQHQPNTKAARFSVKICHMVETGQL
jgi:hypothetical protein